MRLGSPSSVIASDGEQRAPLLLVSCYLFEVLSQTLWRPILPFSIPPSAFLYCSDCFAGQISAAHLAGMIHCPLRRHPNAHLRSDDLSIFLWYYTSKKCINR